jgi:hypothetical protein
MDGTLDKVWVRVEDKKYSEGCVGRRRQNFWKLLTYYPIFTISGHAHN